MKVLVTTLLFTRGRGGGCVVGSAFKTRPPSVLAGRRDFHELLLPFDDNHNQDATKPILASKRRQDFVDGMQRAGIGRIAFLRHGKTGPKPDWGTDFDRVLTEEGREQARISGASFGRDMLPPYHGMAIVSPAPRTMETAKIFLEAAGASSSVQLEAAAEVYEGTMQPGGPKLFAKIGYAPLADYVRNNSNDLDRATARRLLGAYAHRVVDILYNTVTKNTADSVNADGLGVNDSKVPTRTLLLVGHAIYLPAAALGVASLVGCDTTVQEMILTTPTREAEGYLIHLDAPETSRYLERPSPTATTVSAAISNGAS